MVMTFARRRLDDLAGVDDQIAGVRFDFEDEPVHVAWRRSILILTVEVVLGAVARALEALRRLTCRYPAPEMDAALPQGHQRRFAGTAAGGDAEPFERAPWDLGVRYRNDPRLRRWEEQGRDRAVAVQDLRAELVDGTGDDLRSKAAFQLRPEECEDAEPEASEKGATEEPEDGAVEELAAGDAELGGRDRLALDERRHTLGFIDDGRRRFRSDVVDLRFHEMVATDPDVAMATRCRSFFMARRSERPRHGTRGRAAAQCDGEDAGCSEDGGANDAEDEDGGRVHVVLSVRNRRTVRRPRGT